MACIMNTYKCLSIQCSNPWKAETLLLNIPDTMLSQLVPKWRHKVDRRIHICVKISRLNRVVMEGPYVCCIFLLLLLVAWGHIGVYGLIKTHWLCTHTCKDAWHHMNANYQKWHLRTHKIGHLPHSISTQLYFRYTRW